MFFRQWLVLQRVTAMDYDFDAPNQVVDFAELLAAPANDSWFGKALKEAITGFNKESLVELCQI